ncbi:MAG: glycosyltransferase, partial [Sphingobacteriales bacterium]
LAIAAELVNKTTRSLRIFLVGDGDERPAVEAECRTRGLDYTYYPDDQRRALVTCVSWQTQMDEVYAGLDIVALTSHNEGTPVSVIEAQAAAKPVVATDVGGVRDTMADGSTGFLIPAGGVAEGAARFAELVENGELRDAMGRAGRAFAEANFSVKKMVAETTDYYHELLRSSKERKPVRP